MPDELESVLWRPRSTQQLSLWQTSSGCVPSQSASLTFIRDSTNVKLASDCSLICSVIRPLSLFKHWFHPWCTLTLTPPRFTYSLCPSWWMRSPDTTLTCFWPPCPPLSCFFFLQSWALYTHTAVSNTANIWCVDQPSLLELTPTGCRCDLQQSKTQQTWFRGNILLWR